MPANPDLERHLLGALLRENRLHHDVVERVEPDHFFVPVHRESFRVISELMQSARSVNAEIVASRLGNPPVGNGLNLHGYLGTAVLEAPKPLDAAHYAGEIRDLAAKRAILERLNQAAESIVHEPGRLSTEILAEIEESLFEIHADTKSFRIRSLGEVAAENARMIERAYQQQRTLGIDMPLASLRELVGPLLGGKLYVFGSPPGGGKTAIVQQIGEATARAAPGLIFSQEMKAEEIALRRQARDTGISLEKLEAAQVCEAEVEELILSAEALRDLQLYIDDTPRLTVARMKQRARRMQRTKGLGVVAIDHLQLIRADDPKEMMSERYMQVVGDIKETAKDLDIPVILLSQYRRGYRDRDQWRPNNDDLYGGAAIEQYADVILRIFRPEVFPLSNKPPLDSEKYDRWAQKLAKVRGMADLYLTKKRNGRAPRDSRVRFIGEKSIFADLHDDVPAEYEPLI